MEGAVFGEHYSCTNNDYFMVRIDPDKITSLKSEAQSKEYLRNLPMPASSLRAVSMNVE